MQTRPARREDLTSLLALCRAHDAAVRGFPDTDEVDLLEDWDSDGFDLAAGTLVVEDGEALVGYAVVAQEFTDAVPDPARPDVLPALLAWVSGHPGALEHYVPDGDGRGPLLSGLGWSPARRFWRMRRPLTGPLPAPRWPAGVDVRGYDRPADDVAVHALITRCFREIGGQHERTLAEWSAFLLETDRFDPALYRVVVAGDEVVGAALSQDAGDYGFVRQLAVAPAHRGRGLALALLHDCFARHAARGLPATVLGVDAANPTGALQLYDRAGMTVHEQFTRWDRPDRP